MEQLYVYVYEVRRHGEVVATGRLTQDEPLKVGERVKVLRLSGEVSEITPLRGGEWRVVIKE